MKIAKLLRQALTGRRGVVFLLVSLIWTSGCKPAPAPPPEIGSYREVGDFRLIDQNGDPIEAASFRGKVWIANFIFTSCSAECLVLSHRMGNLQRRFEGNPEVGFVSFSVDPGTDTPARLTKYAKTHGAGEGWSFLTGEPTEVDAVVRDRFLLPVEPAGDLMGNVIHSDRFAVVDRSGVVRSYVHGLEASAEDQIAAVVAKLLAEPPPSPE